MPQVRRLAHVCLGTTALERLIGFYGDLLEAHIIHEFRNPAGERYGALLALAPGTFLELFNEQNPEARAGQGLFRHLCFEVEDIEAMAAHTRTLGFTPEVKRGRTDRTLQFTISDPDGTPLEFHQYDKECVQFSHAL
jgi:catechol 2,3-dioxygenase-like lactoylglutathione lyase family enzyme